MNTFSESRPSFRLRRIAATLGLTTVCASFPVSGDSITASATPNMIVPDGNDSGIVSILNVPASVQTIEEVSLTLNLVGQPGGAWNGDLYVYIAHAGVLSVLVNRPGVATSNPFGYGDNGLAQVTFDDDAVLGDFHVYQSTLGTGDSDLPITGIFQPDARLSDPSLVIPEHERRAFLSVFDGQDPSGEWRLFLADLSLGGSVRLASWELNIDTGDRVLVPETATGLTLAGFATLLLGVVPQFLRRRRA